MKKRILTLCMALVLCLSLLAFGASAGGLPSYSGGSGTENDPYKLSTVSDLEDLALTVNFGHSYEDKYFVLTADITTPVDTIIGIHNYPFDGHFDGAGHTVTLAINQPDEEDVGLFGHLSVNGEIKNVSTVGYVISGSDTQTIGGVCGSNMGGAITGCTNNAFVSVTNSASTVLVGGVCGYNVDGSITNCANKACVSCTVAHDDWAGGVCGFNMAGSIANCVNFGSVIGPNVESHCGGICGQNSSGAIVNCFYDNEICNKRGIDFEDDPANAVLGLIPGDCKATAGTADALIDCLNEYAETNSLTKWVRGADGYPELPAVHVFDQCVEDDAYLKTPGNCETAAVYYKSCVCGYCDKEEADTFTSSVTPSGHAWKYDVIGNVLIATCENDNCTDSRVSAYLVLNAEDKVYDGNPAAATIGNTDAWKTLFGNDKVPAIEYYDSTDAKLDAAPKAAGDYTAKITVEKDTTNETTAEMPFSITKAVVPVPTQPKSSYIYNGYEQNFELDFDRSYLDRKDGFMITGIMSSTDVSDEGYQMTASLVDKANATWSDGTTADKVFTFYIQPEAKPEPKLVPIPTQPVSSLVYTGKEQTFMTLPEDTEWEVDTTAAYDSSTGKFTGTDVGEYHVVLSLSDSNSTWSDGTKDAKTITFNIDPAPLIIDVKDKTAAAGGTAPDLSAPKAGTDYTFLKGPCSSDLGKITVALDCRNLDMDQAGVYEIQATVGGDSISNYEVIVATGSLVVTGSAAPYVIGDLNGDGLVNSKDVIILARHVADWNGYKTLPVLDK